MIINRICKAGIAAGVGVMMLASAAFSQNVATVNATQIFGTIDPAKINDYTEYMAGVNMYDALTTLDSSGNILPLLADSWDVSDDTLTYTFHLKSGVKFQDGSPVEAKDVACPLVQPICARRRDGDHAPPWRKCRLDNAWWRQW